MASTTHKPVTTRIAGVEMRTATVPAMKNRCHARPFVGLDTISTASSSASAAISASIEYGLTSFEYWISAGAAAARPRTRSAAGVDTTRTARR